LFQYVAGVVEMRPEVVGSPVTRRRRARGGRLRQAQDDSERPKAAGHFSFRMSGCYCVSRETKNGNKWQRSYEEMVLRGY